MIQDIYPYRLDNQFKFRNPEKNDYLIFVQGNKILCRIVGNENNEIMLPIYHDCNVDDFRYLISIDDTAFFSSWDATAIGMLERDGYEFRSIQELRTLGPKWLRFSTLTAFSYASWYEKNRYCGRCGALMVHSEKERAMVCHECRNLVYPKICPVVIVGVIKKGENPDDDRILLTKYADKIKIDRYALIAGFAEIGETIEQTVAREVREETGLKIKNLHFYKSQPWAFSDSLLFGFYCEVDGEDEPAPDGTEVGFAEFMYKKDVPALQDDVSLTSEMMGRFKNLGRDVLL